MIFESRKYPRLKNYDYSLPGYYYVTIHNKKGAPVLSSVQQEDTFSQPTILLTLHGKIAEQQLFSLEKRYPYIKIDKYVVMPTHIHGIIQLLPSQCPRPGLIQIMQAYKSLTTRALNQHFQTPGMRQFQPSFYERVLRDEHAYRECWRYIEENPAKWLLEPEDL